jgi:hypothetical protein
VFKKVLYMETKKWYGNMIGRYNLVLWEKLTLPIEEAKQLLRDHCTYGWKLHAYL